MQIRDNVQGVWNFTVLMSYPPHYHQCPSKQHQTFQTTLPQRPHPLSVRQNACSRLCGTSSRRGRKHMRII